MDKILPPPPTFLIFLLHLCPLRGHGIGRRWLRHCLKHQHPSFILTFRQPYVNSSIRTTLVVFLIPYLFHIIRNKTLCLNNAVTVIITCLMCGWFVCLLCVCVLLLLLFVCFLLSVLVYYSQ